MALSAPYAAALSGMFVALAISAQPAGAQDAAPTAVTASGITLRSVSVGLPTSDRVFPGGAEAEKITANCTGCHSVGMVIRQPALTEAVWQAEVTKMRIVYKAPVADEDVSAIVAYLVRFKGASVNK